jgi:hypothetical protein
MNLSLRILVTVAALATSSLGAECAIANAPLPARWNEFAQATPNRFVARPNISAPVNVSTYRLKATPSLSPYSGPYYYYCGPARQKLTTSVMASARDSEDTAYMLHGTWVAFGSPVRRDGTGQCDYLPW